MPAPIAALRDDFEDNSTGSAWNATTAGNATVAETGGQLRITLPSSTAGSHSGAYTSKSLYDLTSGQFVINIQTMVATGVVADAILQIYNANASNRLLWRQSNGTLKAQTIIAGVTTDRFSATWNATNHKYLRIRHSGSNVLWDSSTDGVTWTNRATLATPFDITALYVQISAACGNVASPGSFRLDDINLILPALSTNWRWTQVVWPLSNRYKVVTLALDTAGTAQAYVVTADGVDVNGDPSGNIRYWSGPADGGRLLTEQASDVAAKAMAVDIPVDGRFDLPTIVEARCIRIYHRSIDGAAYTLREVYPRRLVQADDIEAESIRALHIGAHEINGDHIGTVTLDASGSIRAAGGDVVIDSTGIAVVTPVDTPADADSYKFVKSDLTVLGGTYGYYASGGGAHYIIAKAVSVAGETSTYEIDAITPSGFTSLVRLAAQRATATDATLEVANTSGGGRQVAISADVFMDAGLNVGSGISGAGAGEILAGGAVTANNGVGKLKMKNHSALANNGTAQIAVDAAAHALCFVLNDSAQAALYYLRGGSNAVVELLDSAGAYTPTAGSAGATNIYWSGANTRYEIENKTGGARTYRVFLLQA